jgi:hypothetical protein
MKMSGLKRTALIGFIVGASVPVFWGILGFLTFNGPEGRLSTAFWNAVYITCPSWLIDVEPGWILTPLLNGCLYAVIAVFIAGVRAMLM